MVASHTQLSIARGNRPVGVCDSGLGGLSVLREIRLLLPGQDLLYLADSLHCPYGGRDPSFIRQRVRALAEFLVDQGVCAIVVACNTATGAAVEDLRTWCPLPLVGMEPAVKPAAALTRTGVVGVLATSVTLGTERFNSLVERYAGGMEVITQPCPGLVEQVELGALDTPETVNLLRGYVDPLLARGADTLVLGCTHYPFLRPALQRILPAGVQVIDAGAAVARQTAHVLGRSGNAATAIAPGWEQFFTTGNPLVVAPVLARLWGSVKPVRQARV